MKKIHPTIATTFLPPARAVLCCPLNLSFLHSSNTLYLQYLSTIKHCSAFLLAAGHNLGTDKHKWLLDERIPTSHTDVNTPPPPPAEMSTSHAPEVRKNRYMHRPNILIYCRFVLLAEKQYFFSRRNKVLPKNDAAELRGCSLFFEAYFSYLGGPPLSHAVVTNALCFAAFR